jgi:hypothetical protein
VQLRPSEKLPSADDLHGRCVQKLHRQRGPHDGKYALLGWRNPLQTELTARWKSLFTEATQRASNQENSRQTGIECS